MGPLTSMDMGSGIHYSANYDNGYRLNNYQYGITLSGIYSYDNNHNITNISRESIPANTNYSYDNLDRIKQESGGPTNYSYDKLGNRTSSTYGRGLAVPYEYDVNSNKLIKVGNVKPRSYDANGNTLASFGYSHRFSYNKANRMVSYRDSKNTLKAEYNYNGIGQRIYKQQIINGGKAATSTMHHLFIYNANGQILQESIQDATVTQTQSRDTIWLGNKPIAQMRTINGTSTIYYILSDHLNTPRKLTNATGTVLWSWNSDAFGTTPANQDVDGDGTDFEFNLRFPGQYFDKESGIHYNYFRDYEAGTGRYLESDPIGLSGNINTYAYVSSNSNKFIDIYGLYDMPAIECSGYQCGGVPFCYSGRCSPPVPPPENKCKRKCRLIATGSCSGVGFYAGRQAFTVCMMTTGIETAGGSTPVCLGVAGVTARAIGKACKIKFKEKCEKVNNCCDK